MNPEEMVQTSSEVTDTSNSPPTVIEVHNLHRTYSLGEVQVHAP